MDLLLPVMFILALVTLIGVGTWHSNKQRRALWAQLAERYHGQAHLGKGWFFTSQDNVVFTFEGIEVKLDQYVVSRGKNSTTYTRTGAHVPVSPRFRAEVYKETPLLSSLGKALGGQDIVIGDAQFDSTFIIKGNDEAWMQRKLSAHGAIKEHIRQHDLHVSLQSGYLTLKRVGACRSEPRLMDQVRLTAYYAQAFSERPMITQAPAPAPSSDDAPTHTAW